MCVCSAIPAAQSCTSARPPRRARPTGVRVGPPPRPQRRFHCGRWQLRLLPPGCESQASPSSRRARRKSPPGGSFVLPSSFMKICSSVLQSSPNGVFRRAVSIADRFEQFGVSHKRPGTPPWPLPSSLFPSLDPLSGRGGVCGGWCHLALSLTVCALQVHPGRVVSGLPSSLSLSDTPLRRGSGLHMSCLPMGAQRACSHCSGVNSLECFTAGQACLTTTQVVISL